MARTSDASNESEHPATVLVVDDVEANRALAQAALEDEGYRVVLATGGAEGIEAFERERPECVLLDVRMPEVDGFTVSQRIRALPGGPETPIVFLTAQRDVDTFDRALRAGADDFLTKPVRPTELVVRVESAIKMKRMRAELREHYDLLKRQRDDLLRLQLQKERLMSFVVHDLKNPVNGMDLHAQLLLRDKSLGESARASALQIRSEARQLSRLILNLLDLSKGDEGKLVAKRTTVDPCALVTAVAADLELSATARRVRIETRCKAKPCSVDPDLLQRTLANLTENAIRHAPASSVVTVGATSTDAGIDFTIADQGTGVPEAMRERIFDPFVQIERVDGRDSRTGRGLGLAFCRLAVEAHGGRIWVEDGKPGAVFRVRLPHAE
ncbi:MAG TPA: hybrid sensor histidine kinase/response regulator [Polyangiaceae bacterium]|nr:hybrid sensor histidine kinase/response regulator [Polyangiaceae bacterium]